MENKRLFTIGYIEHDNNVHSQFLGKSIDALIGEFNVISKSDKKCPAENYNEMLDECKTPYLILTHQDISFSSNLLERIEKTIEIVPNFGALGIVGADYNGNIRWSDINNIYELDTLDSCFIVIKVENAPKFDSVNFNEYHLYVEDYCGNLSRNLNKKIYTIAMDRKSFEHHSATLRVRGGAWGNYMLYRKKLNDKWYGIRTT